MRLNVSLKDKKGYVNLGGGERYRPGNWMQKLHSEVVRRPHKKPDKNLNADNELALAA